MSESLQCKPVCFCLIGGTEGGHVDRRVPDGGNVCRPIGGHCGGGKSGRGHSRGLEESNQWQPHCWTGVSSQCIVTLSRLEQKILLNFKLVCFQTFMLYSLSACVAWTPTLWSATPSGRWVWVESSWCWLCMGSTRPRSRDTSVPARRKRPSCGYHQFLKTYSAMSICLSTWVFHGPQQFVTIVNHFGQNLCVTICCHPLMSFLGPATLFSHASRLSCV